jgi:hypothetical protein
MSAPEPIRLPLISPDGSMTVDGRPIAPKPRLVASSKGFAPSKPTPGISSDDRDLTSADYFAQRRKDVEDDVVANEILMLWTEMVGGHFSEPSIRAQKKGGRNGLHELLMLQTQHPAQFGALNVRANSRSWSKRLSMLAKAGLIRHTTKGYFPAQISKEAKLTAIASFADRMESLKLRDAALAGEIQSYLALADKFGSRCERRYFGKGSVDGLAPVTAARCVVNDSHVISKKMISVFGLPKGRLSGAANMLLEECSVNQARARGLVFTRVSADGQHLFYNVPKPDSVSFHIQRLHDKEIVLPRELREVLLRAAILANHLEQFVHDVNTASPEKELYRAMTAEEQGEGVPRDEDVDFSEQPQEVPDVEF